MSGPAGSSQWMYASGEDYTIDQSLRFNNDDSASLSWTPSSAGNRKTWTWSGWVKRGHFDSSDFMGLFTVYSDESNRFNALWTTSDTIEFQSKIGGSNQFVVTTDMKFRDNSAWFHIMMVADYGNATQADRFKVYVNGSQITLSSTSFPDHSGEVNNTSEHRIGQFDDDRFLDGYLAEVHFIDGTALTPSSFGETGTYGEWKPIEYDVTDGAYGTNGFYLSFAGGGVMSATGGTITTDGDYKVHSFTADGTFTPTLVGEVEYLVIAGGGGGGAERGGGGGAGGYRTGYLAVAEQAYSITVGDGGAGGPSGTADGAKGSNSVFSSITSEGGGLGPAWSNATSTSRGGDGGSGGGAGGTEPPATPAGGGSATAGQGNDGGGTVNQNVSGGGGGAGGAGQTAPSTTQAGAGGAGLASSITGSSVTRAGGGGGSRNDNAGGAGGSGGGGTGGGDNYAVGGDGTANTGSGGGGGGANGGDGGSGIVILRYKFQ